MKEVTKGQVHKEKRDINKSIRGKIFPRQKEKYGQRIQTWTVKAFWGAAVPQGCCYERTLRPAKGESGAWLWQSCVCITRSITPTLCDPIDCSPPGSSVHGIFQARTLEWAVISSSRGSFAPRDQTQVSHIAGRFFTVWAPSENPEKQVNELSLTSPMVQWLRPHLPKQGVWVWSLVRELGSHMPLNQKPKTCKHRRNSVTNSIKIF